MLKKGLKYNFLLYKTKIFYFYRKQFSLYIKMKVFINKKDFSREINDKKEYLQNCVHNLS